MMQTVTQRRCHKQPVFVARIQRALGVTLGSVQCNIVNIQGMSQAMRRAGWSANETQGVVGFQYGEQIYVLDDAPWTVLHELIHRAGVNADRLNRYVAEGLTEAIAVELKESPDEHRPTYPTESAWVRERLLPRLGLSAVQLGALLAKASDPPAALADLMLKARPDLDRAKLVRELAAQQPKQPSFNRKGCVTRSRAQGSAASGPVRDGAGGIAGVLLVAGAVLAFPGVGRWWMERERIPGGLAAGRRPDQFDPAQLQRGIRVELEHTSDPSVAREIAMDHLIEHPNYYTALDQMERGLKRGGRT